MKVTKITRLYWLIPVTMILVLSLAACASEPPEPEIVRETVEVPMTVEVTREIVQEIAVTRLVETEIEVTRVITNDVEVTRLTPMVPPDYLVGGLWTAGPVEFAFLNDGTWLVLDSRNETIPEAGEWHMEGNEFVVNRTEGPCAGTAVRGQINEIYNMDNFRGIINSDPCGASKFVTGVEAEIARLDAELPTWAEALLAERGE